MTTTSRGELLHRPREGEPTQVKVKSTLGSGGNPSPHSHVAGAIETRLSQVSKPSPPGVFRLPSHDGTDQHDSLECRGSRHTSFCKAQGWPYLLSSQYTEQRPGPGLQLGQRPQGKTLARLSHGSLTG